MSETSITDRTRIGLILSGIFIVLLIPAIAMQFTEEVNWTISDFAIAATLLLGAGILIELTLRFVGSISTKLMISGLVILLLILVWAELAVGLFGTPFAGT